MCPPIREVSSFRRVKGHKEEKTVNTIRSGKIYKLAHPKRETYMYSFYKKKRDNEPFLKWTIYNSGQNLSNIMKIAWCKLWAIFKAYF